MWCQGKLILHLKDAKFTTAQTTGLFCSHGAPVCLNCHACSVDV